MKFSTLLSNYTALGFLVLGCSSARSNDLQGINFQPDEPNETAPIAFSDTEPIPMPELHPEPPMPKPPTSIIVISTLGDLYRLEPEKGALLSTESAKAIDAFACEHHPGILLVSEWNEEAGGAISTFDTSTQDLMRVDSMELSIEDTRLIHGPDPMLALGIHEGFTLFSGLEGRSIFPISSFLSLESTTGLEFWLLESSPTDPELARFQWKGGLVQTSRTEVPTPNFACPPRLIRNAPTPVIIGLAETNLMALDPKGTVLGSWPDVAPENACVHDTLWLSDHEVAIMTGPEVRIHLVHLQNSQQVKTLVMTDRVHYDPHPHRRLAFDAHRNRLWLALSERLMVMETKVKSELQTIEVSTPCTAQSVTVLW